jgi:hypothetical protein
MGILSGAIPRQIEKVSLKSPKGVYQGFFTGMAAPYQWESPWQNDPCKGCGGTKRSKAMPDLMCSRCGGTGLRIENHVKLYYSLENGVTEEEDVQFKISAPSTGKNAAGQTVAFSPSTLYLRLRELSGIPNATPEQLDAWYDSLHQPISVPIILMIGDNQAGTALKIASVTLRQAQPRSQNGFTPAPGQFIPNSQPPVQQIPYAPPVHANGGQTSGHIQTDPGKYASPFVDPRGPSYNTPPPEGKVILEDGSVVDEIPW